MMLPLIWATQHRTNYLTNIRSTTHKEKKKQIHYIWTSTINLEKHGSQYINVVVTGAI
jgi:hypothetical protein